MLEYKTCGTCVWATRFKDGLRCIDGKPVDEKDGCSSWQPDDRTTWQKIRQALKESGKWEET